MSNLMPEFFCLSTVENPSLDRILLKFCFGCIFPSSIFLHSCLCISSSLSYFLLPSTSLCHSRRDSVSSSRSEGSSWRVVVLMVFIFVRINMTPPVCQQSHPATWPGSLRCVCKNTSRLLPSQRSDCVVDDLVEGTWTSSWC